MYQLAIPLELRFHPSEKSKLCSKEFLELFNPIVYYRSDENLYSFFGNKYFSITYYLYFYENFAIGLNGIFPKCNSLGYHKEDIENIRILYNMDTLEPTYVFFSAHAQEGIWKRFSECKFHNNKLIVYVSYGSHALRPICKTYYRLLGFANDYCSNDGEHIIPLLLQDYSIPYLNVQNEEVFSTSYKAFIMPFIIHKKEKLKEEQKNKEDKINKFIL